MWQLVQWKQAAGAQCWLGKHVDPHTVPSDICVAMNIDGPKWRNGDPPCAIDMPLDISQTEFLGAVGLQAVEGVTLFAAPPSPLHICGAAGVTQT